MSISENLSDQDQRVLAASGYCDQAGFGARPAVLIVDVNVNFCGDRDEDILESLQRWRNSCGHAAWRALPHLERLIDNARSSGTPVIYTTGVEYQPYAVFPGRWLDKNARIARILDDPEGQARGNQIMPQIAPQDGDIVIRKSKPSAFFGTDLVAFLTYLGIDSLIVAGATTSGCVRATVVDAFSRNYLVSVVEEGTFDRFDVSHDTTLFDIGMKYCDVVSVDAAVEHLITLKTPGRSLERLSPYRVTGQ